MKTISRLALVLTVASAAWANGPEPILVNADFELGKAGQLPSGWKLRPLSESQDYKAQIQSGKPHAGTNCLEINQDRKSTL